MIQPHNNIRRSTDYARIQMADKDLQLLWHAITNGMPIVRICEMFQISTTLYYRFKEEARLKFGDSTKAADNIELLVNSKTRLRQLMNHYNGGKSKEWLRRYYDLASMEELNRALVAGEEWKQSVKKKDEPVKPSFVRPPAVYSNKNYSEL